MPLNLRWLTRYYSSGVLDHVNNSVNQSNDIKNKWENFDIQQVNNNRDLVEPLIDARFNQGPAIGIDWPGWFDVNDWVNWDWNNQCPEDSDGPGGHALVGCVAVSMAQVIHYWSSPVQPIGNHGYNSPYGYLYVDFETTNIIDETFKQTKYYNIRNVLTDQVESSELDMQTPVLNNPY